MSRSLDAAEVLVPVARRREERALEAPLPTPESCGLPPRVHLEEAYQLIREMTKWGEKGGEFLKSVFFDDDRQPRHLRYKDMEDHCLGCGTPTSPREVKEAAARFIERLESCGLIVSSKNPIMWTQYALNPTPGVTDLLGMKEQQGATILEVVEKPLSTHDVSAYLSERLGAPFKTGSTCADIAARLGARVLLSDLLRDGSLYVEGYHQGGPLRDKLTFYLNEGIRVGLIKYEVIRKDCEEREVFSLTEHGARYLNGGFKD